MLASALWPSRTLLEQSAPDEQRELEVSQCRVLGSMGLATRPDLMLEVGA
jgi:hypothetical protein